MSIEFICFSIERVVSCEQRKCTKMVFLDAIREKSLRGVAISCDAHVMSASSGKIRQPYTRSSSEWDLSRTFSKHSPFCAGKLGTCGVEYRSWCKCLKDFRFTRLPPIASKNLDFFSIVASLDHHEVVHKYDGSTRMKHGGLQHFIRCTYLQPSSVQFVFVNKRFMVCTHDSPQYSDHQRSIFCCSSLVLIYKTDVTHDQP